MANTLARDEADLCASYRRPGELADAYRIWADGPILRIEGWGVWSVGIAESYTAAITRIVGEMRQTRSYLRVIVDRREALSVEAGAHELLLATYGAILRAGDRVAMVVDSSFAKGQIRKVAGREETQAFLSISAAEMWVLAYG